MLENSQGTTTSPHASSAEFVEEDEVEQDDGQEEEEDDGLIANGNSHGVDANDVTSRQALYLYVSHSLSMWNSRMYEFAVILFIQAAFPGNLTASSINGIAETVCVLFFSSALGRWVDGAFSRLRTLILTIVTNRITVLISCLVWFFILSLNNPAPKHVCFAVALLLGMVEKLSRGTNILSMERDWIPSLANPTSITATKTPYDLTHLNTVMRRIDLLCKLVAPLAVSSFISAAGSERLAVVVVAAISALSWGLECWCVQQVWNQNSRLRAPKKPFSGTTNMRLDDSRSGGLDGDAKAFNVSRHSGFLQRCISDTKDSIRVHVEGLQYYFGSSVWIPSVCAAIPHASVLTFSGTMITYLLNAGFPLNLVTGAKVAGAVFEIGSTILFPWAVGVLSKRRNTGSWHGSRGYEHVEMEERLSRNEDRLDDAEQEAVEFKLRSSKTEQEVIKTVGWWALCGLFLSLIPALFALFYLDFTLPLTPNTNPLSHTASLISLILLIASISLSLLFRWTYDLSATQLTQTLIPASHRSSFGGTEMAIVSLISLTHWVAAAIWHSQRDFRWLATGSLALVGGAVGAYTVWHKRGLKDTGAER